MRYSDCEIGEYKIRDALRELSDANIVNGALDDIRRGDVDSLNVRDVMARRAGSRDCYDRVKAALDVALRVARACGAA